MEIDRVDLADCTSPERIVAEILRQVPDMPIPVPIKDIATAVGITDFKLMTTDNFEGGLITQPERRDGVILVNSSANKFRKRFTIGHELGHYLISAHQPRSSGQFTCSKADMEIRKADRDDRARRMEMEANRFSAGMLMPLPVFKADLRSLGAPDLSYVVELAQRYDVSKEAMAIHYTTYHSETCAVIFAKDGIIKRVYKPTRFPFIEVSINHPLPVTSWSAKHRSAKPEWEEVDQGTWLSSPPRPNLIREQSLGLARGWSMTMLIAPDEEDEQENEMPDAFDVWENPKFPGKKRRRP